MLPDGESLILSFSSRPPTFQRQLKAWKSENVKTQFTKERIITKDTPQCLTDKCQDIEALSKCPPIIRTRQNSFPIFIVVFWEQSENKAEPQAMKAAIEIKR